jgi:hypothetical protein
LLAGCTSVGPGDNGFSGSPGSLSHSATSDDVTGATSSLSGSSATSGSSTPHADASAGSGGDDGQDGIRLDVGAADDGLPPTGLGCNGVDLLFVIDNSGSMQPYQEALADTFPAFADAIFASLPPQTDIHVALTTTSFGSPSAGGVGSSECSNVQHNDEALADHYPPPTQHNGQNGGQGRLYEYQGKTYWEGNTDGDPSGLKQWFSGAAVALGEQGSNWEMVTAGGAWVAHPDNATANAGFLRDAGVVLVMFFVTDEHDNSPESVAAYRDLILDAKAQCGGEQCVITGGLTPTCVPETPTNILNQFLHAFGTDPILGDVGEPEDTSHYPDVLGDTLAQVIVETCETIPPAG